MNKKDISASLITRNLEEISGRTGNIYESIIVISKRARNLTTLRREELSRKLEDFATPVDSFADVVENPEQIEISRSYERQPKPATISTEEFIAGELEFRRPESPAGNPIESRH